MLISKSAKAAKKNQSSYTVDGQIYVGREYIGIAPKPGSAEYGKTTAGADDSPQAYLVMQPPGSTTRPHFHQANQFQVFVGGGGTVGKARTDPVTVQYAGGHTPYGPIVAEDRGIDYFTLRQKWDSGAKYLPASRDALNNGRQRQRLGVRTAGRDRPGDGEIIEETLIALEPDGLFGTHYALAPGARTTMPDAAEGGGQYHVVLSGALIRDGEALPPLSIEFATPDEGGIDIQAGAVGLEILLLRFPRD